MEKQIFDLIKKYDNIAIFRHEFADPDALGAQFGLKSLIEDNFENKNVKALGQPVKSLNSILYPEMDEVDDAFISSALAIILDTANSARIDDKRYKLSLETIKIDHHPIIEDYADINIVDVKAPATSFILINMARKNNMLITSKTATYFYSGLVGDTGRFLHSNTTAEVFDCASFLLENGANIIEVYEKMYTNSLDQLRLIGYIQQNFKTYNNKIVYFYLRKHDYEQFNIEFEKAKEHIYVVANIENIKIWVGATFNPETKYYHVSIRSNNIPIDDVAAKFGGGGHKFASGVKVSTIARVLLIVKELHKKL